MAFSLRSSEAAVTGVLCFGGGAGSTAVVCTGEKGQARVTLICQLQDEVYSPLAQIYLGVFRFLPPDSMSTKVGGTRCFLWYFVFER